MGYGKGNPVQIDVSKAVNDHLTSIDTQLADIATVNNHTITYGYDTNVNIKTVTEKDASNNTIKTVTYTYDTSGNVTQSVTVMNGQTVTTTYNYDASGNITSTVNAIS
jgi:YD repeat-containing protein